MLVVNLFKLQQQQQLLTLSFHCNVFFLYMLSRKHMLHFAGSNETVAQIDTTV